MPVSTARSAGDTVQISDINDVRTDALNHGGCRVYHDANQTITTGVATALAFNQERYDEDAYHDTVTNNSRLTIPAGQATGAYFIWANVQWENVTVGLRVASLRLNGATTIAQHLTDAIDQGSQSHVLACTYQLAATDYVEVMVQHARGSNAILITAANYSPEFGLARLIV